MPKNGHLNENSDAVWFYPWEGGGGSVWPVKGAGYSGGRWALLSPLYLAPAPRQPHVTVQFLPLSCWQCVYRSRWNA